MNHRQYNFPAYRAFRVNFHIKIILEEFPCVVGNVNSKATVNSVCHLVSKKDQASHQGGECSALETGGPRAEPGRGMRPLARRAPAASPAADR